MPRRLNGSAAVSRHMSIFIFIKRYTFFVAIQSVLYAIRISYLCWTFEPYNFCLIMIAVKVIRVINRGNGKEYLNIRCAATVVGIDFNRT